MEYSIEKLKLIKYFTIENKSGFKSIESKLRKFNPDLYNEIIEWNKCKNISFKEKIYRYIHKINKTPKCYCGLNVKFTESIFKGYRSYCSRECSGASELRNFKTKQTNIERYGVDSPFKSNEFKEKIKTTNL